MVPFGGRRGELDHLHRWRENEKAPPRFLLVAPGGRGKSALLVHWIREVEEQQRPSANTRMQLIFVPISMRFNTNRPEVFYEAIAARLAAILEQRLAPAHTDAAAYYEDHCRLLLGDAIERGMKVLIVVDGIDEAIGETFNARWFPRGSDHQLRLLVSARLQSGDVDERGWTQRLGWDSGVKAASRSLPALDRNGVDDLLSSSGLAGAFALRQAIIDKLWELTQGEPLVLRLYVEELCRPETGVDRLKPEDLIAIRTPGLAGYFGDWLRRQRQAWQSEMFRPDEERLLRYLAVLACACGPLTTDDLNDVARRAHGIPPPPRLADALHPLRRLVIGTGKSVPDGEVGGYVLTHPRFGDFLRNEYLDTAVVAKTQEAFLQWGRDTVRGLNEGNIPPEKVPPYLVQHFSDHLVAAGASVDDLMTLAADGWRRAWFAYERGYRGFSRDIGTVLTEVRKRSSASRQPAAPAVPFLGEQLRCVLCLSSIGTIGTNVYGPLLAAALQVGIMTDRQALNLIALKTDEERRVRALGAVAGAINPQSMPMALEIAHAITDHDARARALGSIAAHIPGERKAEILAEALAAATAVRGDVPRARAISVLAPHLSATLQANALAAVRTIQDEASRAEVLGDLAPHLSPELKAAALADAREINDEENRAWALTSMAPYGLAELNPPTLSEALDAAAAIGREDARGRAVSRLVPQLTAELKRKALEIARAITDLDARAEALSGFAPGDTPELQSEVLDSARLIEDGEQRAYALARLAPHFAATIKAEALATIRTAADEQHRAQALIELAPHLPPELQPEALAIACAIANDASRAQALAGLAPRLAHQLHSELLAAAAGIASDDSRGDALSGIAPYLKPELHSKILTAARAIRTEWTRAKTLAWVAPHICQELRSEAVADALAATETIRDEAACAHVLSTLSRHLPAALKTEALNQALNCVYAWELSGVVRFLPPELQSAALARVQSIEDEKLRAEQLSAIAPQWAEELQLELLAAAHAIQDKDARERALTGIAPHLAGTLKPETLAEALAAAAAIQHDDERSLALRRIMPHLSRDMQETALAAALAIGDETMRATTLSALAPHLAEDLHSAALAGARAIPHEHTRAQAIAGIAPYLCLELQAEALREGQVDLDDAAAASRLNQLMEGLPEELTGQATLLATACSIRSSWYRANVLLNLAGRVHPQLRSEALAQAVRTASMVDEQFAARALTWLSPYLPPDLLAEALAAVRMIRNQTYRAGALSDMAPYLPEQLRSEALLEALNAAASIGQDYYGGYSTKAEALSSLAPKLSLELRSRAIRAWLDSAPHVQRLNVFNEIAAMIPALFEAGAPETPTELLQAVRDVGRWWP